MLWIGPFLTGMLLTVAGCAPLAIMFFPLPVAVLWARGRRGTAVAAALGGAASVLAGAIVIVLAAGLGEHGVNPWGILLTVAVAFAVALMGGPLGALARSGKSFGMCVTVLSFVLFIPQCLETALLWDELREASTIWFNARIAEAGQDAGATPMVELMRWADTQLPNVAFGMTFAGMFAVSLLMVGILFRMLRVDPETAGQIPLNGQFKTMRPPDGLVWLAILAALLGLADYQWPNPVLRFLSWNTGVALAMVYGLNGLGIVLCALEAFGAGAGITMLVLLLLFVIGGMPMLAALGFFDTWFDQRLAAARTAELWKSRNRDDDDDGPPEP